MESLCSEDQREQATGCCICRFPLPQFCADHAEDHQAKGSDFHVALPLSATQSIPSRTVYEQVKGLLFRLSGNWDILREKLEEMSLCEEKIEVAYQETLQHLNDMRQRLKQEFLTVKEGFRTAVENAINETCRHALECQTYVHEDSSLSHLLWYADPEYLSSYQFYTFQANCAKERLETVLQVWLYFSVPGLDALNVTHCDAALSKQMEAFAKQMTTKEEMHQKEVVTLNRRLEETSRLRHENDRLKDQLARSRNPHKDVGGGSSVTSPADIDVKGEAFPSPPANPKEQDDTPSPADFHHQNSLPGTRSEKRDRTSFFWKSFYAS